jgi:hypothetical protein
MWTLFMSVLMLAAWNTALMCGLCPPKSSKAKHCAEKETAQPVRNTAADSLLAVQNSVDPCSHCVTHSPWQTNSTLTAPNSSSHGLAAPPALHVVVAEFSASNSLVEIHDHGPPGNVNPRYILNSTFLI